MAASRKKILRVGSRASALARAQTNLATNALREKFADKFEIKRKAIVSSGDRDKNAALGGVDGLDKGVFVKEIEQELLRAEIDVAVHSLKDAPLDSPEGLEFAAFLPRADVRDVVLFSRSTFKTNEAFPKNELKNEAFTEKLFQGLLIGASSLRRTLQVQSKFPQCRVEALRGNVPTRIRRLGGKYQAIILAKAGLDRLGAIFKGNEMTFVDQKIPALILDAKDFCPAASQAIIGLQIRGEDEFLRRNLQQISCPSATFCASAEREFLKLIGADCHSALGVTANCSQINVGKKIQLQMRAQIFDGEFYLREGKVAKPHILQTRKILCDNLGDFANCVKLGIDLAHSMPI